MDNTHDMIAISGKEPIEIMIEKTQHQGNHWHNYTELIMVLEGRLSVKSELEVLHLNEEDIILINSNEAHEIKGNNSIVITIKLNLDSFSQYITYPAYFKCNSALYSDKDRFHNLKRLIAKLVYTQYNKSNNKSLEIVALAYQLMNELITNFRAKEEQYRQSNSKTVQRLKNITEYLQTNYADNITLQMIAEKEFLSPTYLSHFFEKNMGISFFNYLTKIRLLHAVNDLVSTDQNIEQIAINNGFANSRYFVSSFKKAYGMLPKDYRKESQPKTRKSIQKDKHYRNLTTEQYSFLNKLGRYLSPTSDEIAATNITTKEIHSFSINLQQKKKRLRHTFKTCTSVGKAKDIMLKNIQHEITTIQKEIGYEYIKFHGLLDDSMQLYNEDGDGNPYLTFHYVDEIMDFLLSIRLRPLVELSFMPSKLAKDCSNTVFHNPSIISAPSSDEKWCFLINGLVNHFINRYGLTEVRQWLFTFWNVPFDSSAFAFESEDIMHHLYRLTYRSVKSCDNEILFGSPSFAYFDPDENEFRRYMDFAKSNDCFPDFYTLHCFPVITVNTSVINEANAPAKIKDQKSDNLILSEDVDFLKHTIEKFKQLTAPYAQKPIYLDEWSSTASHREWLNDTCYKSAYIVKNLIDNYDSVECIGHWCISDTLEELPSHNNEFHGELGLFTNHQIKKPAYWALCFVNQLYNILVEQGEGFIVTKDINDNYCILMYNYIPVSPMYAKGLLFHTTHIDRYNAFVDPVTRQLDFSLSGLQNGSYVLSERIVNRDYGSAFDEWVQSGALPLESNDEIEIIKGRSKPLLKKRVITVENERMQYFVKLKPHEIRLMKLTYQRNIE